MDKMAEMVKLTTPAPHGPPEGAPIGARTPLTPRGSPMGAPLPMGASSPMGLPCSPVMTAPGGFSLVLAGMETPEVIELRTKKIEEAMDGSETPQLFTVVPEKRKASVGMAMMGSTHIYDMSTVVGCKGLVKESWGVDVALAPEELELDPTAMTQKYEEHVREQQVQVEKEDFSDMVAEHTAKQKQKKRKAQAQDARGGGKKYKEFKF